MKCNLVPDGNNLNWPSQRHVVEANLCRRGTQRQGCIPALCKQSQGQGHYGWSVKHTWSTLWNCLPKNELQSWYQMATVLHSSAEANYCRRGTQNQGCIPAIQAEPNKVKVTMADVCRTLHDRYQKNLVKQCGVNVMLLQKEGWGLRKNTHESCWFMPNTDGPRLLMLMFCHKLSRKPMIYSTHHLHLEVRIASLP